MRKVTIVDIAHELDISPSTVSRALNGIGRMNSETRQQILDLAKKWDYHPNPHAQRLKKVKTSTIGLIIPELTHHFYSQMVKGVDCVLDEIGYQQIICVSNEEYEKEKKAAEALLNGIGSRSLWPKAVRIAIGLRFRYRFKCQQMQCLHGSVAHARNA